MKKLLLLPILVLAATLAGRAEDAAKPAPKPDLLKTCAVSGEKLEGEGDMKPFTFVYQDQEVKLCCKSCKKDFDKTPDKFIAKIRAADPAEKK